MLAWTEQVKCRGLSEQPNYARVATKPCNMKLVIGITKISVNFVIVIVGSIVLILPKGARHSYRL